MAAETTGKPASYDFDSCERAYAEGGWSINALANKYGIPEPSLRRYAKQHGWVKGSSGIKREMVKEALAGMPLMQTDPHDPRMTNTLTNDEVRQLRMDAAVQDLADMNLGLTVARKCMATLLAMVDTIEHPKEVKLIVESNKLAVETIRKIRSLDADEAPETNVSVEVGEGFAELRAAFQKRLAQPVNDANPAV